jgi:dipeptidyl aminopeptidase/acylaminoacyl peptidase
MMHRFTTRWIPAALLTLALALLIAAPLAAQKRPITVEDLWAVKRVGAPSLSPDGKWVAVSVTTFGMDDNKGSSDLWLLATDASVALGSAGQRRLTSHTASDSSPQWSPDGKWIAFLSRREGDDQAQIYLISPEAGEARRLTRVSTGVSAIRWFPDSSRLAFISWVWPDLATDAEQAKRLKEQKDAKVKAYVIDQTRYRYWDHWIADGRVPHLFVADAATGAHSNLFAGTELKLHLTDPSADDYHISPDGKEIAFASDLAADPGFDPSSDLVILNLETRKWQNITGDNPAGDSSPRYSPDGKWIAYGRNSIPQAPDRTRVALYERATGGKRVLTEGWDLSAGSPEWAPDSQWLYFTAEDRARVPVWRLAVTGGEPVTLVEGGSSSGATLSADGRTLAFIHTTMADPPGVFAAAADGSSVRKLESFNDALTAQWKFGEVKEVTFKGWNDEPVQMWVIFPPDFDPAKKWPLVHAVHGGPHGAWLDQFHFRWNMHLLASRGHVVAAVNFHGSTGWGDAFTDSITGQFGAKELADTEAATDYLIAAGYIDPERLAAAGGSFGGFMVAFMNGKTDRYKAYVCHAGVYDYPFQQTASDSVRGRQRALGGWFWENPEIEKQSARAFTGNMKTPTLIIHGELDYRVPLAHGLAYYAALKMKQVPTRLLYFPDENHWVLKPQNSRLWHSEVFSWLEKYVSAGATP